MEYADTLDIPVAFSSNGDGFLIQYRKNCRSVVGEDDKPVILENASLEHFPTPEEL